MTTVVSEEAGAAPSIDALFRQGKLLEAIATAGRAVKAAPQLAEARILLAELLLFEGDRERTDAVLEAAAAVDPQAALAVGEFRQLLRAEMQRRQVLNEGRPPDFIGGPTPSQRHLLAALAALREGDPAAAVAAAAAAEAVRPHVPGTIRLDGDADGSPAAFDDFRDADDLCSGAIDVLTTTGRYFWIAPERIASMTLHPPKRLRDLVWRRCTMLVREGPDGEVYIPALYDMGPSVEPGLRLGRATEWSADAPVRGSGQRMFLVGEEAVPIQRLCELEFA